MPRKWYLEYDKHQILWFNKLKITTWDLGEFYNNKSAANMETLFRIKHTYMSKVGEKIIHILSCDLLVKFNSLFPSSFSLTLFASKITSIFLTIFSHVQVVNHYEHIFLSDDPEFHLQWNSSSTYSWEHSLRPRPQLSLLPLT